LPVPKAELAEVASQEREVVLQELRVAAPKEPPQKAPAEAREVGLEVALWRAIASTLLEPPQAWAQAAVRTVLALVPPEWAGELPATIVQVVGMAIRRLQEALQEALPEVQRGVNQMVNLPRAYAALLAEAEAHWVCARKAIRSAAERENWRSRRDRSASRIGEF